MKFEVDEVKARAGHVLSLVTQFLQPESNACAFACLPAVGAEDFAEGTLFSVIGAALENVTAVEREKVSSPLPSTPECAVFLLTQRAATSRFLGLIVGSRLGSGFSLGQRGASCEMQGRQGTRFVLTVDETCLNPQPSTLDPQLEEVQSFA